MVISVGDQCCRVAMILELLLASERLGVFEEESYTRDVVLWDWGGSYGWWRWGELDDALRELWVLWNNIK